MGLFFATLMTAHLALATLPSEPIDQEISQYKPKPEDSANTVKQKCTRLAKRSQEQNRKLLLIGIEGQDGFSADNAWLVYRYLWRLQNGSPESPPNLNTLAPVLHRLLLPLAGRFGARIEVLNFPETSMSEKSGGAPEICALAWSETVAQGKIALFGHSFGADAIHMLADHLSRKNIPLYQAYSIDAVAHSPAKRFFKPLNLSLWTNFFQRNEPPFGAWMYKGDSNQDLSSIGVNHRTIVRSEPVLSTILTKLQIP